ncbi:Uma2 family endonuclease [Calothrix sp. FACHB-1219]|uniref:Uma2 family endonuclease n=1 Tax=unclassified Calothrix TaxID=2619626 RepID=UPI001684A515|nr:MULTISPECIES: Uma2 family endonuclease [unclassified Calothrix]MBD2203824.1 Uma2 family endonuclease [Calothrix sp. FACHB-168]MBD2219642.1 Uma2 family endonuclease [Calothrix sp. FACHB-1219]
MSETQTQLPTDTWILASWQEYLQTLTNVLSNQSKSYYYKGHMRLEIAPVSFDHGQNHVVIIFAVTLFAALKGIPATGLDTTTFRKTGIQDCQPDIAYYVKERAQSIPTGTGIVNLDLYPAPDLVIEIAKTSLLDDLGTKRSLYEELNVSEYWVVDVQNAQIIAYAIAEQGSKRIQVSQVLPGLAIAVLEAALRRSREMNQSQVGNWLLTQFQ